MSPRPKKTRSNHKQRRTQGRSGRTHHPAQSESRIVELDDLKVLRVEGLPPTGNLRKHPDEAYGDTEIPARDRTLNEIKHRSR